LISFKNRHFKLSIKHTAGLSLMSEWQVHVEFGFIFVMCSIKKFRVQSFFC